MKIFKTRNGRIADSAIDEIVHGLERGALLAFPTETVYGLGCLPDCQSAQLRIYEVKGRDLNKPLAFHINRQAIVGRFVKEVPQIGKQLMERFWPGPLTLIFGQEGSNTLGFRLPDCPPSLQVIEKAGGVLCGTSANKSGQASPRSAAEVMAQLGDEVDYLIDGGPCRYGQDSTIISCVEQTPQVLRRGCEFDSVASFLQRFSQSEQRKMRSILFVCTGNTCRSVMGAAWLEKFLKSRQPELLLQVDSAGIYAAEGMKASEGAIRRMLREGVDLSSHRSKGLSKKMIEEADLVFCMSYSHARHVLDLVPKAKEKVIVLNVEDPIGLGDRVYDDCLEEIIVGIQAHIGRILEG